jgi:tetratricopeptide (TPR) repeat protein
MLFAVNYRKQQNITNFQDKFTMKQLKLISFLLFAVVVFTSCSSETDVTEAVKPKDTVPAAELIKQSEALFAQRKDVEKLREAVKTIARARNADKRDFEVEWRFAKYNYFLSKQVTDEKEAEKLLKEGYAAGMIASRLEPNKPDGYFWYSACLGEQSRRSPVTVGIKSVGEIQEGMNKVIQIDPKYQGASAFDGLAQVELKTTLVGGKPEKAVELLEKGLEYDTGNGYIHLHLAEAYLAVKKEAEAKKQLEYILKMKMVPEFEVEHEEIQTAAKKLLDTKF